METQSPALLTLPPGVAATCDLLHALDPAWLGGFANLGTDQHSALERLGAVFSGTPLADRLGLVIAAFDRSEFTPESFLTLAVARSSLQGAIHDALQQQLFAALGRPQPQPWPPAAPLTPPPDPLPQATAIQHWLMELALAGLGRLEPQQWIAFGPTLAALQQNPHSWGMASLLTGWLQELALHLPCLDPSQLPLHRWVDLWSRAFINTLPQVPVAAVPVAGTFAPIALDIRSHGHCLSLRLQGLLWTAAHTPAQRVHLNHSTYTVDTITGAENWLLLEPLRLPLTALAQGHSLQVRGHRWPNGALHVEPDGELGETVDRSTLLQSYFGLQATEALDSASLNPSDRHPIQLGELVWLQDYTLQTADPDLILQPRSPQTKSTGAATNLGPLRLATEQIHALSGFTAKDLAKAKGILGQVQWDGGQWSLKPLGLSTGKKWLDPSSGAVATWDKPPKTPSVATLQERASRLLRPQ